MCARLPGDILNYLEDKLLPRSLPVLQKSFLACINPGDRAMQWGGSRTESQQNLIQSLVSCHVPATAQCHLVPITPPRPCPNKVICPQSTAFLKTFLNIQIKVYSVPPCCNKRRNYKSMHTYICISFYIHKIFYKFSKKIIVLALQNEER